MNVRTFLLGALCGAVAFSIIDRLMEERERRVAARGAEAPRAEARSEARPLELDPAVTPAPNSGSVEEPVASAAAIDQDVDADAAEHSVADGNKPVQPPRGSDAGVAASVLPDDETWGPYMEQTLRQFLAGHRSAVQFDVLGIRCVAGLCEIQVAGFDESTWPVWSQVLYDLSLQPWYEFGEAGSSAGRVDGRYILKANLKRLPRK